MRRLAVAGLILTGTLFTPLVTSAQECAPDLTEAIIALTQAQADAAAGDTGAALDAISDVQAELAAIQQNCDDAAPATSFDLSESFSEPDILSFDYPAGWFAGEFHEGLDWETLLTTANVRQVPLPPGGTVPVSSAEITAAYSPFVALDGVQSVTVLAGTPMHIYTELGLYSTELAEEFLASDFDFALFSETLEMLIEESPLSPTVEMTRIEAERPTVRIEAQAEDTNITMVLVALDESQNRYALLVSTSMPDDPTSILPLLVEIAATVE